MPKLRSRAEAAGLDLPEPLDSLAWYNPAAWGRPADAVTAASMLVLLLIPALLLLLLRGQVRVPVPLTGLSAVTLALVILITRATASRPSSAFARGWCVLMLLLATGAVAGAVLDPQPAGTPWLHAFGAALFLSALVLGLRLKSRLRISGRGLMLIAPFSLFAVPAALASASFFIGRETVTRDKSIVTRHLRLLDQRNADVRAATASNGIDMNQVVLDDLLGSPELWATADKFDLSRELVDKQQALAASVVRALDGAPSLSSVELPENTAAGFASALGVYRRNAPAIIAYHKNVARWLRELQPPGQLPSASAAPMADNYENERGQFEAKWSALKQSFSDHWVAYAVDGEEPPPLREVLKMSIGHRSIAGAAQDLVLMKKGVARSFRSRSPESACWFHEQGAARLECTAFQPSADHSTVEARVVVSIVYGPPAQSADDEAYPTAVEYLFFPTKQGGAPSDEAQSELRDVALNKGEEVRLERSTPDGFKLLIKRTRQPIVASTTHIKKTNAILIRVTRG